MWLGVAVCAGCAGPAKSDKSDWSDKSDESESGWVIRGSESEKLLLTNGASGLWVSTARGIAGDHAFRMLDGALVPIPGLAFNGQGPLEPKETLGWTFDLRTGEFVSVRRGGSLASKMRIVLHPTRPICAVDWEPLNPEANFGVVLGMEANLPAMPMGRTRKGEVDVRSYHVEPAIEGEMQEEKVLTLAGNLHTGVFGAFLATDSTQLPESYGEVLAASKAYHDDFWQTDIEIDGPPEDQLAIRTMLYYLRWGATPKLPPFGASSAKYRGARFWDAEAWILPVLAVVDPKKAQAATEWRFKNTKDAVHWEEATGGRDVTPKEFGNALHVAGWVAWWFHRAELLGLNHPKYNSGILMTIFRQFLRSMDTTARGVEFKGVESPDEGRPRDNDLVTNVLARQVGEWADEAALTHIKQIDPLKRAVIPRAKDGLPASYDDDLIRGYQQAAALLAVYPLEYFKGEIAGKMFDRYADLTSEVGPAMSESIHATIAARLKRPDAHKRWRRSWQTYTDNAMMFHERRNKQDAYFMTGAAGCLQAVLYGFAGMHIEREGIPAGASKSLGNGYQVAFRPSLPSEWKSVTLRNVFLGPTRATVHITHSGVTIEKGE